VERCELTVLDQWANLVLMGKPSDFLVVVPFVTEQNIDILGFARMPEVNLPGDRGFVDRLLFDSPDDRRDAVHLNAENQASAAFSRGVTILEAKQWDADFERRFNKDRQHRDVSPDQILS
jgi:hypothetical protein